MMNVKVETAFVVHAPAITKSRLARIVIITTNVRVGTAKDSQLQVHAPEPAPIKLEKEHLAHLMKLVYLETAFVAAVPKIGASY